MSANTEIRFNKIRLATGPRLHFAEQGSSTGEPIVFLHGWPDSWFTYSRVLSLLPPHVRALTVDQRGFGDSDRPESGYSIPDFAADILAFLDALKIDRVMVVGHSFGSFVARQVAIAQPGRVSRLVLIGTGFAITNPVMHDLQTSLRDLADPVPPEFAREFQASTAYRSLPPEFFERIVEESLKLPSRLWAEMIDRLVEYDDLEDLPQITAPTLLIWGDRDALFSRNEQDRFVAKLPQTRVRVYEETGHCPNWEQPERVAADITRFLRGE